MMNIRLPGVNYLQGKQLSKDGELKYSNILPLSLTPIHLIYTPTRPHSQLFVRYGETLAPAQNNNHTAY